MNITFFIGNGFDINLGLRTRYKDFYPKYMDEYPEDILTKEIEKNDKDWSDLELALGQFLKDSFEDREEVFIQSKNRMDNALSRYLAGEAEREIIFDKDAAVEFRDRIVHIDQFLSLADAENYKSSTGSIGDTLRYQFVSFNYTNALDTIIEYTRKQVNPFAQHKGGGTMYTDVIIDPIHIHGTIDTEMILGVNSIDQMSNDETVTDELSLAMIKSEINDSLGNRKNETIQKIIDESRYIIVYGMSLGLTDLKWWQSLFAWLKNNIANRLIIFHYSPDGVVPSGGQTAQRKNRVRKDFFTKIKANEEEYNKYKNQVIVQINSSIFSFSKIHIKAKTENITG